jgi:hypothetical protein
MPGFINWVWFPVDNGTLFQVEANVMFPQQERDVRLHGPTSIMKAQLLNDLELAYTHEPDWKSRSRTGTPHRPLALVILSAENLDGDSLSLALHLAARIAWHIPEDKLLRDDGANSDNDVVLVASGCVKGGEISAVSGLSEKIDGLLAWEAPQPRAREKLLILPRANEDHPDVVAKRTALEAAGWKLRFANNMEELSDLWRPNPSPDEKVRPQRGDDSVLRRPALFRSIVFGAGIGVAIFAGVLLYSNGSAPDLSGSELAGVVRPVPVMPAPSPLLLASSAAPSAGYTGPVTLDLHVIRSDGSIGAAIVSGHQFTLDDKVALTAFLPTDSGICVLVTPTGLAEFAVDPGRTVTFRSTIAALAPGGILNGGLRDCDAPPAQDDAGFAEVSLGRPVPRRDDGAALRFYIPMNIMEAAK